MTTNNAINNNLAGCSGLPVATGISGLGTGVATALAVNIGSAGAPVTFNGAGGTPSSITLTNGTGLPGSGISSQIGASNLPAGTLFNFQSVTNGVANAIAGNSTWNDLGLSVTITPTSSSNKVNVRAAISGALFDNAQNGFFRLVRNSTPIGVGSPSGAQTAVSSFVYVAMNSEANSIPICIEFLDTPATTSSTTYKVQYFSLATNFQFNYNGNNVSASSTPNGISTISVCEVHA